MGNDEQTYKNKVRGIGIENTIQVHPNSRLHDIKAMYHSELGTVCIKDIKGVYKNCRGIWAAQWTDDNGQRHTKYFNPKYFTSEESARVNAYKFKLDIQLTMERQKGLCNANMPFLHRQISNPIRSSVNGVCQGEGFEQLRSAYQYGFEQFKDNKEEDLVLTYAILISLVLGFCGCRDCAKSLLSPDVTAEQAGYVLKVVLTAKINRTSAKAVMNEDHIEDMIEDEALETKSQHEDVFNTPAVLNTSSDESKDGLDTPDPEFMSKTDPVSTAKIEETSNDDNNSGFLVYLENKKTESLVKSESDEYAMRLFDGLDARDMANALNPNRRMLETA